MPRNLEEGMGVIQEDPHLKSQGRGTSRKAGGTARRTNCLSQSRIPRASLNQANKSNLKRASLNYENNKLDVLLKFR